MRNLICPILVLVVVVVAQPNITESEWNNLMESLFTKDATPPTLEGSSIPPTVTTIKPMVKPTVNFYVPPSVNDCPEGECVPYHRCRNNTLNTDGMGLINIKFDTVNPQRCVDYLEKCCRTENIIRKSVTPGPPLEDKSIKCGYRNTDGIGFRILKKENESEYAEYPWVVGILKKEQIGDIVLHAYQCGGSLIHPKVVLTAAHCSQGRNANTLIIRAGEWDTQTDNEILPHQDRNVAEIIVHPQFNNRSLFNDISLLVLSEPVKLDVNVQTICLPPQNAEFDNIRCTACGWGKDKFGRAGIYQVILKKIELPIVPRSSCQALLRRTRLGKRFNLHESFICAGGESGIDTCEGDGGSPLACPIENTIDRYYQSGIVAWGIGCGENHVPAVYASVAKFRNWIDHHFMQLGLDTSSYIAQ